MEKTNFVMEEYNKIVKRIFENENSMFDEISKQFEKDTSGKPIVKTIGEKSITIFKYEKISSSGKTISIALRKQIYNTEKNGVSEDYVELRLQMDGYDYIIERNNGVISYKIKPENGQEQILASISSSEIKLSDLNLDENNSLVIKERKGAFIKSIANVKNPIFIEIIRSHIMDSYIGVFFANAVQAVINEFNEIISTMPSISTIDYSEEEKIAIKMISEMQDALDKMNKDYKNEIDELRNQLEAERARVKDLKLENGSLTFESIDSSREKNELIRQVTEAEEIIKSIRQFAERIQRNPFFRGIAKKIIQIIETPVKRLSSGKSSLKEQEGFLQHPTTKTIIQEGSGIENQKGSQEIGENGGGDEHD